MNTTLKGSELKPSARKEALRVFVHRFTRDHKPRWANDTMPNGGKYGVQFASDEDWLNNTVFHVTKNGDLNKRIDSCYSTATWPDGVSV